MRQAIAFGVSPFRLPANAASGIELVIIKEPKRIGRVQASQEGVIVWPDRNEAYAHPGRWQNHRPPNAGMAGMARYAGLAGPPHYAAATVSNSLVSRLRRRLMPSKAATSASRIASGEKRVAM